MLLLAAERYAETVAIFLRHDLRRIPRPEETVPEEMRESEPKEEPSSRKRNSIKAVKTRKGRYGESKTKRSTREQKKKEGHEFKKE